MNLVLVLSVVFFLGCSYNVESTQTESLDETWNVKNISGGFAGINDDYQTGEIIWTFNEKNLRLTLENYNSQQNVYSNFESGTYNYALITNNGYEYLFINNGDYGKYTITTSTLSIDQNQRVFGSGADEFLLLFER